jgi:hypothetical protein
MRYYELLDTDIDQVNEDMQKLFRVQGPFSVDKQGYVSANGSVIGLPKFAGHYDGFMPVRFKAVGDLQLKNCALISLAGCPQAVTGSFDCSVNHLDSLKAGPKSVGHSYNCSGNVLTSLHGAPEKIQVFICDKNHLTNLQGAPKSVDVFSCKGNSLRSLEGFPAQCREAHVTYTNKLPLLRLVGCEVQFTGYNSGPPPDGIQEIFAKYVGQKTRQAMASCQNDLMRAGLHANAVP